MASLLALVFALVVIGLNLSALMSVIHTVQKALSNWFDSVEEPDPTEWIRKWDEFFYWAFMPAGQAAVRPGRKPMTNRMLFHLSISLVGVAAAMGMYTAASGVTLGAVLASYYSVGAVPDLSPLIRLFAAGAVLFGLAVIFHAGEKAKEAIPDT
jgi:hypothetical protein